MKWEAIDEEAGLWSLERVIDDVCVLRSVALRLRDGALAIISPMRESTDHSLEQLEAIGPPEVLVAPNHFHNMGLNKYGDRFEGCRLVASQTATKRLSKKTRLEVEPLELLRERLPPHVTLLQAAGTRNGEVLVSVKTEKGALWVVADAFFNYPTLPKGAMGLGLRIFGLGPELRVGKTFKHIGLADKKAYAQWLSDALDADTPQILIPAHGEIVRGNGLALRLRNAAARTLPL